MAQPGKDADALPQVVFGYISVKPKDGRSVLQADDLSNFEAFYGDPAAAQVTRERLEANGLTVVAQSSFGIAAAGAPEAWEEFAQSAVTTVEKLVYDRFASQKCVTHVEYVARNGTTQPARIPSGDLGEVIDAIAFERPRARLGPAARPPAVDRFHLSVPDDVARLLGADPDDRQRGRGVRVAMVDSGWFRHPFFTERGYEVEDPHALIDTWKRFEDPCGHGTGESANLFAVAPGATLVPIRAANDNGDLVGSVAGFMLAKSLDVDIISNSWGGDTAYPAFPVLPKPADRMLELEIREAIFKLNKVVVFAGGNGGFGVEAQIPGVISAGGVYADEEGNLSASEYASAFVSPWFRGARDPITVPMVCGLVGQPPRASYLMLPVPPDLGIDVERSGADRGDQPDGTARDDGWALFSGTSAAAPQVAGAAAVLLGLERNAKPEAIAEQLRTTATNVAAGRSHVHFGASATQDTPDLATGHGLINVAKAVETWPPSSPQRRTESGAPDFEMALAEQGLIATFLELGATDDDFRSLMDADPRAALVGRVGLQGDFTVDEHIRMSPKFEFVAALQAFRAGYSFQMIDTSGQLARMLA
jgi:subtilisin family serine protease